MKSEIKISHLAEADLVQEGFNRCLRNPRLSKCRAVIRPGYRSIQFQQHIAYYTIIENGILIQRVLHKSMDPDVHFE